MNPTQSIDITFSVNFQNPNYSLQIDFSHRIEGKAVQSLIFEARGH